MKVKDTSPGGFQQMHITAGPWTIIHRPFMHPAITSAHCACETPCIIATIQRNHAPCIPEDRTQNANATLITAAPDLYLALKTMNHDSESGEYCICPLRDGLPPDKHHSTSCLDARKALRKAEGKKEEK